MENSKSSNLAGWFSSTNLYFQTVLFRSSSSMTSTIAGTSASRLAALHLRRDKDADFSLCCQGTTIAAHSFLLAST